MKVVKSRFRTKKGGGFCATNSSLWSALPVGVVGTTLKWANETSPHLSEETGFVCLWKRNYLRVIAPWKLSAADSNTDLNH